MKFTDRKKCQLSFSEKEIAVSWFYMTGMTLSKISEWTGLSEKSASHYKRRAMNKVGARNDNEFMIWFLENRQLYLEEKSENSILRKLHCKS